MSKVKIYGIGYLGDGVFSATQNNKPTKEYNCWRIMMKRCYDDKFHEKQPTYKNCTVAEEWHNFQNFAKWYNENYYEVDGYKTCLDKDILTKGNKIYSPETCVFVPQNINSLMTNNKAKRGGCPVGIYWNKANNKYRAKCNDGNSKSVFLGDYDDLNVAFNTYKNFKENLIKEMANKYIGIIPNTLYKALINYRIDIND